MSLYEHTEELIAKAKSETSDETLPYQGRDRLRMRSIPTRERSRWMWWGLLLLWVVVMSGCENPGTGEVQGRLQVTGCETLQQSASWSLPVGFTSFLFQGRHKEAAAAELRLQTYPGSTTHRNPAKQDILLIEIHQPELIKANQVIPIVKYVPRLSAQSPNNDINNPSARATLLLKQSCPNQLQPFEIEGSLTFTEFGPTEGSTIAGNFTLTLSPARPSDAGSQGNLSGSFTFPLRPSEELGSDWLRYEPGSTP